MSDCDVNQMEEWITQPIPVKCRFCQWKGREDDLLADNKCPECQSIDIATDF